MSPGPVTERRLAPGRALEFLRFCAVGGTGFVIDAGALAVGTHIFGLDPIAARFLSFGVAVLATFELNRRWAFKQRAAQPYLAALSTYLGVQSVGFACNFSVYAALYFTLPLRYDAPLLCLAVASAAALAVNYAGASLVVFRTNGPPGRV